MIMITAKMTDNEEQQQQHQQQNPILGRGPIGGDWWWLSMMLRRFFTKDPRPGGVGRRRRRSSSSHSSVKQKATTESNIKQNHQLYQATVNINQHQSVSIKQFSYGSASGWLWCESSLEYDCGLEYHYLLVMDVLLLDFTIYPHAPRSFGTQLERQCLPVYQYRHWTDQDCHVSLVGGRQSE